MKARNIERRVTMTNMIRCGCGYVAREADRGEALKAAELHLKDFHPEIEQGVEQACQIASTECTEC